MIDNTSPNRTPTFDPITYLNNGIWCRIGVSNIAGVGIIAIRDIPADTNPFTKTDYFEISKNDLDKIEENVRKYIIEMIPIIDGKLKIVNPNSFAEMRLFINHSKTPNYNWSTEKTILPIKNGEEITTNYRWIVPDCEQFYIWDFMK